MRARIVGEFSVLEIIQAGGWLMVPLLLASVVALAICVDRLLALRIEKVAPDTACAEVLAYWQQAERDPKKAAELRDSSPLAAILLEAIVHYASGRESVKETLTDAAGHEIHRLERGLNSLGTIAAITPLLGLLGTVIGMIRVFTEITVHGTGDASILAGGISEALITTASGLTIAIPALMMHRYFLRRLDAIVVAMEQQSIQLLNTIYRPLLVAPEAPSSSGQGS